MSNKRSVIRNWESVIRDQPLEKAARDCLKCIPGEPASTQEELQNIWPICGHHACSHVTTLEPADCLRANKRTRLTVLRYRALLVKERSFGCQMVQRNEDGFTYSQRRVFDS